MKRQKSISSAAASISAWNTVFDWPSIVAALIVSRQVVVSSSAALRMTAARSSNAQLDHSARAAAAASIACGDVLLGRLVIGAEHVLRDRAASPTGAVSPVRISLPPMISGMSTVSAAIVLRRALSDARSGEPGA